MLYVAPVFQTTVRKCALIRNRWGIELEPDKSKWFIFSKSLMYWISFADLARVQWFLPTSTVQEMSGHAMRTLSAIQQFFTYHLVDNFGCDYSSSGLTIESVQSKLRGFFQQSTADGPRYDTYLVYYSGQVYENGHWALTGIRPFLPFNRPMWVVMAWFIKESYCTSLQGLSHWV